MASAVTNSDDTKLVNYKVEVKLFISSQYYEDNLAEIIQRTSVIVTCHLFHRLPIWRYLRPSVASELCRGIMTIRNDLRELDDKSFHAVVMKNFVNLPKQTAESKKNNSATIKGCLELIVQDYAIELFYDAVLTLQTNYSNIKNYRLAPEPAHIWIETIQLAISEGEFFGDIFYPNKVDKLVSPFIVSNQVNYIEDFFYNLENKPLEDD